MLTLKYVGIYVSSHAFLVRLTSASGSRLVRVLLPGEQYIKQFKEIIALRGFDAVFYEEL